MAQAQVKSAHGQFAQVPPPPGVDPALLTQDIQPSPNAIKSLEEAIADLAWARQESPSAEGADNQSGIEALKQSNALRLYVSGRTKRLEGDIPGALSDFEAATRLDPDAGEPWRELGETQLNQGSRRLAATSFANALKRGVINARMLEVIGRHELEQHDVGAAVGHLAAAVEYASTDSDRALSYIVYIELAQGLKQLGFFYASMDSLRNGLRLPDRFNSSTQYYAELNDLYRRRGDLWLDVGDTACRLGRFDEALEAYRQASALPTLDAASVTARTAYAAMKCGAPAIAAVALLDDLYQSGGRTEQRHTNLIRYTAAHSTLGPKLAAAIEELQAGLESPIAPSTLSGLVRARAASLSTPDARRLLRHHLKSWPSDMPAFAAFLNTFGADETKLLVQNVLKVTQANPHQAPHYASSIHEYAFAGLPLIDELTKNTSSIEARLLAAYLHAQRAAPERGLSLLPTYGEEVTFTVLLARVELAAASGHWRQAEKALQRLDEGEGLRHRAALSQALRSLQRNKNAFDELVPLLENPAVLIADRLAYQLDAAEYNFALGRVDDAERYLLSAVELDPSDDRAFERLVALYSPTGPLANSTKLTQTVRSLRQASASSRLLRWIRAQELARQQLWSEAERYLTSLAEEQPSDRRVIDLLTIVWEQQSAAGDEQAIDRAETWLRRQLERRQDFPTLLSGLAGIFVTDDRPQEAESLLRDALASDPHPDVSRALEWVLRDHLGRADEANAMTRARLEGRIRSIEEGLELAELLARIGRLTEALIVLRHDLPDDINYRGDQIGQYGLVLSRLLSTESSSENPAELLPFFDLADRHGIPLTATLHQRRFSLLAHKPGLTADQIFDAARLARQQIPAMGVNAFLGAAKILIEAQQTGIALDLLALATNAEQHPPPELLDAWLESLIRFGSGSDVEMFVARIRTPDDARSVLDRFLNQDLLAEESFDSPQADLAYRIGGLMMFLGRTAESNDAMRVALKIEPRHIWANNDLGYALANNDQDLEEALGLIQTAYEQEPQSASVQDSLGWALYKLGRVHDEPDPAGGPASPGAISVLIGATQTTDGQSNPVILDHLGDALWIAGRHEEADQYWRLAQSLVISQLQAIQNQGENPQEVAPSRIELLAKVRAKYLAVDAEQEPLVANHQPVKTINSDQ